MSDMNLELDQNKLLGNTNTSFVSTKKKSTSIPFGYITINLDSLGKYDAPMQLHFRDFSLEELTHISLSKNSRDNIKRITECLNKMIFEDFDCTNFHMDELMQVVINLYGSFMGTSIEKDYYINPDIKDEEKLKSPDNIDTAIIKISEIKTKTISDDFEEPLNLSMIIENNIFETKLRQLRIKDILETENHVNKFFEQDIRKLSNFQTEIDKINKIENYSERVTAYLDLPEVDRLAYEKYTEDYNIMYVSVLSSMPVIQVGDLKPQTIEEKIKASQFINRGQWKKYDKWIKDTQFGIIPEITFTSSILGVITRRFSFQPNDFVDTEQE